MVLSACTLYICTVHTRASSRSCVVRPAVVLLSSRFMHAPRITDHTAFTSSPHTVLTLSRTDLHAALSSQPCCSRSRSSISAHTWGTPGKHSRPQSPGARASARASESCVTFRMESFSRGLRMANEYSERASVGQARVRTPLLVGAHGI